MTIRELMEEQRMLVHSSDLAERLAAALLIPGLLRERLRELDDFGLGQILDEVFEVCSNLSVLAPKLTVCMDAADRLCRHRADKLVHRTRSPKMKHDVVLRGNLHAQIQDREPISLKLLKGGTSPNLNAQDLTSLNDVRQLAAACQGLGGIAGCQGNQSGADNDLVKVNTLITSVSKSASAWKEGLGQTARRLVDQLQALANEIIADPVVAPRHKALAEAVVAKGCIDQAEIKRILVPATLPDYSGRIEEIAKRFNIPLVLRAPKQGLIF